MPGLWSGLSIYEGDSLRARYIASAAPAEIRIKAFVEHSFGPGDEQFRLDTYELGPYNTFTADRTTQLLESPGGGPGGGCIVTGGGVQLVPGGTAVRRGAFYIRVSVVRAGSDFEDCLCCGYVYDARPVLAIGEHIEPGPGGGEGNYITETLAADIAPVDITKALAATNTIRKIMGYAVYYNASADAATRTSTLYLLQPLGSSPTGFAIVAIVWASPTLTLTASEEGVQYGNAMDARDGFISQNDNNSMTYASTATSPSPFPVLVTEDDPIDLRFDIESANANDRWSVYLFYEEWLVL